MRERDQGRGAHGGRGAMGARARLGRAGSHRGPKPTTRITTNRNPITNRNPKWDETNTRLTTTSDKEICFSMIQHP
jgi:ribosomal protein L15